MYFQEKKTDDSYFFTAEQDGKYVFCLANQKSSLVPKLVYFMFDFLNDEKRYQDNDDGQNKTGMNKFRFVKNLLVVLDCFHVNVSIILTWWTSWDVEHHLYIRICFLVLASEVDKVVGDLSVELLKLRRTQVKQNVRMETHFKSKFILLFF